MESCSTTSPPSAAFEKLGKHPAPPLEYNGNSGPGVFVALRVFLFTTAIVAIIVMVTSTQTKMIPVAPGVVIPLSAKFNYMPSAIYLVVALAVVCLYSIISGVLSVLVLMKAVGNSTKLQLHLVMFDTMLLGIMASAIGAATGVAYIAVKGNSHTGWKKVCNTYESFCFRGAVSVILSLASSITLLLLVWLSVRVLYKKTTKR